jgi:hypothetical protein
MPRRRPGNDLLERGVGLGFPLHSVTFGLRCQPGLWRCRRRTLLGLGLVRVRVCAPDKAVEARTA